MDRNFRLVYVLKRSIVALRKESVDRNIQQVNHAFGAGDVALRKESVDRNSLCGPGARQLQKSLSARRAWIEIC